MGWRTIIIEQSQQVSLHLDNLKIKMLEGNSDFDFGCKNLAL